MVFVVIPKVPRNGLASLSVLRLPDAISFGKKAILQINLKHAFFNLILTASGSRSWINHLPRNQFEPSHWRHRLCPIRQIDFLPSLVDSYTYSNKTFRDYTAIRACLAQRFCRRPTPESDRLV